ncbi:MAG: hypothetical protein WBG86_13235 [Polyangiales bacterium]
MRNWTIGVVAACCMWSVLSFGQAPATSFLGEPDAPRIAALREGTIASVKKGKGGRSLAFKITLDNGVEGYFKPTQRFSAAHWYSELAAYYLDRELGFGRVPPTTGRAFQWEQLRRAAGADKRVDELQHAKHGQITGAFIWWIPEPLKRLRLGRGWERWVRVQATLPITPYQRPVDYRADLRGSPGVREATDPSRPTAGAPPTPMRPAELSDLIVFDYLTQNVDRWGGDFTNVRTRGSGGPLIYLDNGAGFWLGDQRLGLMEARLRAVQRFRRATVEAVRNLDIERFAARLATDPLAPILNEKQLDGLRQRQAAFLTHVDRMIARFGEPQVLAW